jgi:hypothetical protein
MTVIVLENKHQKSGYSCIIDEAISPLVTSIHATKIRHGTDLEHLISEHSSVAKFERSFRKGSKKLKKLSTDFEDFASQMNSFTDTATRRLCKLSIKGVEEIKNTEVDFVYVDFSANEIHLCELKSGENFDTKKAKGETEQLGKTKSFLESRFPDFIVIPKIVLWYTTDLSTSSFKCIEGRKLLTTGPEFAKMISCSHTKVNEILEKNVSVNTNFVLEHIAKIYPLELKNILEKNEK